MGRPTLDTLLIGVVGPCGAGKSTLVEALEADGYRCRHIAQEHSYVPHMWQRLTDPDILIFLAASFPVCTARRRLSWTESDYLEQLRRLSHAREHADLLIETDDLTPEAVRAAAVAFIRRHETDSAAR
jgi:deoxyadenosine/deoxycytidine kinase